MNSWEKNSTRNIFPIQVNTRLSVNRLFTLCWYFWKEDNIYVLKTAFQTSALILFNPSPQLLLCLAVFVLECDSVIFYILKECKELVCKDKAGLTLRGHS